ncbi:MAG: hypothetical protein WBZ36_01815 [Candidatus Nitrosopolaris sp.]
MLAVNLGYLGKSRNIVKNVYAQEEGGGADIGGGETNTGGGEISANPATGSQPSCGIDVTYYTLID